jgi:NPCBM/NEW2 domain-containing protein
MKLLLPILLLTSFTLAQSPETSSKWTLTTADFKSEPVTLNSISPTEIKVTPPDADPKSIPLTQFLELQRPLPPIPNTAKFTLHLTGGDKLAGEPLNLTAEALVWKNPTLGEISIPTASLVGFARNANGSSPSPGEQTKEDVVTLANGDVVKGIIASVNEKSATVQVGTNNTDVPLDSIATVSFAATPGASAPKHGFRVRLDEGSSLVGESARLDNSDLALTLAKNVERKIPLAHVTAIEQLNGPVSWLSSRTPASAVYYPFVGPARQPAAFFDRQFSSPAPITFKGKQYPHGIAVHAFSRLTFNLDPAYSTFRTLYAVEGDSSLADVTVRIKLDDKVVHEQQHLHSGTLSAPVTLDLKGAKTLTLEVDGGPAYAQDALDWIQPALLKTPG